MSPEDSEFVIGDMHFAAKRWGNPQGKRVIALHGWLDNSASFDFLAPYLPELDLLCPDLAGHGKTDHRSHFGAYNIWQDVSELFALADALGWREFSLIGHSRGAVIAAIAAGTFPERIQHLSLIEGLCPYLNEPHQAPHQLAVSIKSLNLHAAKHQTIYPTLEKAVEARTNGFTKVALADAQALAQRGVEAFEGGFTWAHDYKLMAASEIRFTEAQFNAFISAINVPIHVLVASEGLLTTSPEANRWLQQQQNVNITAVEGDHHLHMSGAAKEVANWLRTIILPA